MHEPSQLALEIAESPITLPQLAKRLGIHPSTAFRTLFPRRPDAARLEAIRCGKAWVTSWPAYLRYLDKLPRNDAPAPTEPMPRSPSVRQRASEDARKKLQAAGV